VPVPAPAVLLDGLVMRYGEKTAVDDLSLTVERGSITAVLGPNGAGKTTTLETCEGYRRAQSGRVQVLGLDPVRDRRQLAVVETPADQAALERTGSFRGLYFVLMGRLSPLDGIGPLEIGARELLDRAGDGVVEEVILATNFTAEGEATAHVLGEALQSRGVRVTRLARGVPIGSELEYVDLGTIAHAFVDRR